MLTVGQLSASSLPALSTSTSAALVAVPPGPCSLVVSNTSGATVYISTGAAATTTNGFAVPTGAPPVTITGYPGSKGVQLNIIASGTITGSVSWALSTPQ